MPIQIPILTGKDIFLKIIWSALIEHRHNCIPLIMIYGLHSVGFAISLSFLQKNFQGTGNPANTRLSPTSKILGSGAYSR